MAGAIIIAEASCDPFAFILVLITVMDRAILEHRVDGPLGDVMDGFTELPDSPTIRHPGRDVTEPKEVHHAPCGICATTKTVEEDAVPRTVVVNDEFVAVDGVGRDAAVRYVDRSFSTKRTGAVGAVAPISGS